MTNLKLHYKSLILILLLSFIPTVSAETTFFDDPNLAFIIGEFAEEKEAVSQPQASTGGGGDISAEVPVIQLPTYASTIELSLGFISTLEKIVSNFLDTASIRSYNFNIESKTSAQQEKETYSNLIENKLREVAS